MQAGFISDTSSRKRKGLAEVGERDTYRVGKRGIGKVGGGEKEMGIPGAREQERERSAPYPKNLRVCWVG